MTMAVILIHILCVNATIADYCHYYQYHNYYHFIPSLKMSIYPFYLTTYL